MVKKENSQNIEEIIKKAVRSEIQNIFEGSINKEEPETIPRNIPKDDVICDCGKDITKFTKQQKEMHSKSRFHLENI